MSKQSLYTLSLTLFIFTTGCADNITQEAASTLNEKPLFETTVIYGEDDRKDWFEVLDENIKTAALSTLGIFNKRSIAVSRDFADIDTAPSRLCTSEKFHEQRRGPFCSGFLVAPDLVLTAGHCISSQAECRGLKFVFDYAITSNLHDPTRVPRNNVYGCKTLVGRELTRRDQDWALVKLDRPVLDRAPLKIRREGAPSLNSPLTLIGHPSGLPSKIARGGKIHQIKDHHFVADLDSFKGNSGSAVFNSETLEVEGILVRGRTDYGFEGSCREVNICAEGIGTSCRFSAGPFKGEHVSKVKDLLDLIPPLEDENDDENGDNEDDDSDEDDDSNALVNKIVLPIPDNTFKKINSSISNVPSLEDPTNLKIQLIVEHTYISDLSIELTAPNGKSVFLHKNVGRSVRNISGVYGENLAPVESFSALGPQSEGSWSLEIKDSVPYDKGHLIKWGFVNF